MEEGKKVRLGLLLAAVMVLSSSVAVPVAASPAWTVVGSGQILVGGLPSGIQSSTIVSGWWPFSSMSLSEVTAAHAASGADGQSVKTQAQFMTEGDGQYTQSSGQTSPGTAVSFTTQGGVTVEVTGAGQVLVSTPVSGYAVGAMYPSPGGVFATGPPLAGAKLIDPVGIATGMAAEYSFSVYTDAIPRLWLDSSRRRSRSQIYIEIVELLARGPLTPFEITFYVRLNHKRTKQYLEFLKRSGYLQSYVEDGRLRYTLTPSGKSFMERLRVLFEVERSPAAIRRASFA